MDPLARTADSTTANSEPSVPQNVQHETDKHYYRSAQFLATFFSVSLSYLSGFAGYIMPANTLTIINTEIGPSSDSIWIILVFVLCQTIIYTISGHLSDVFGRRWFFIGAQVFAFVGFIVCGSAKKITTIIGGSVLSGLGTGIQMTMPILLGEIVPYKHRNLATGLNWVLLGPLGAISPGLARVFVDHASWRWVYYFPAICSGIAGVLQFFFYFPTTFQELSHRKSPLEILKKLDYGGLILFTGSSTSLIFGISWGGQKYPWKSGQVISTIVVGIVGLIAFVLWERFSKVEQPLMPLFLFRNLNFVTLSIVASVGSMVFYAVNIIYPQQVATLYGRSPQATGWMSCGLTAGVFAGQILGGLTTRKAHRFIPIKWQIVISVAIFTAFIGGMAETTNEERAVAFSVIASVMVGVMEVITLVGAPLMVDPEHLGVANGVEFTVRSFCSVLAPSIFVTVLTNRLSTNITKWVVPALVQAGLPMTSVPSFLQALTTGSTGALEKIPGVTPTVLQTAAATLRHAYGNAFQTIYLASLSFGGCAIIAALLVNSEKLYERMTSEVARELHVDKVALATHHHRHPDTELEKADVIEKNYT